MKLLKKQPQKEASSDASLADRIKETCSLAEKYIESRVQSQPRRRTVAGGLVGVQHSSDDTGR